MAPEPWNDNSHDRTDAGRAVTGTVRVAGLVGFSLFGGVLVLAGLAAIISYDQWSLWARIGDAFGAPAVVMTVAVAAITLSRQQRQISRAILRQNHAKLIELALTDPDLAEVWPSRGDHLTPRQRKQHLYADQILQDIFAFLASGEHSAAQTKRALQRVFESPMVRDAWWAAAPARAKVVKPGTAEYAFYRLANEAYVLSETEADPQEINGLEYRP